MKKQSETFDAQIILDKGWRQGSIFHLLSTSDMRCKRLLMPKGHSLQIAQSEVLVSVRTSTKGWVKMEKFQRPRKADSR